MGTLWIAEQLNLGQATEGQLIQGWKLGLKLQQGMHSIHASVLTWVGRRKPVRSAKPGQRTLWQFLCLGLLILGICFRFGNLDKKVFWHDEVLTALRVAGYSRTELVEHMFVGREVGLAEVQAYQQLRSRNLGEIVYWLARENPQHPPFYLAILRPWVQIWGESVTSLRALSVVISLLVFPCLYWLCIELFQSTVAGWIAIALISASPFHVLYAQEAREYTLWTILTLVSSAALLRAIRLQTRGSWLLYTLSLVASLYTSFFSGLVAVGHGIYVLLVKGMQRSEQGVTVDRPIAQPVNQPVNQPVDQTMLAFLTSASYAVLAFVPWIAALLGNLQSTVSGTAWTYTTLPRFVLSELWALNLSRVFVDFDPYLDDLATYLSIIPIIVLEIIAAYFICRNSSRRVWLFILILIASVALPIAVTDLSLGGQRSTATRYLVPTQIGLPLLISYFLANGITSAKPLRRDLRKLVLTGLITVGIFSCSVSAGATTWWNKGISYLHPQIAQIINTTEAPVIISDAFDTNPGNIISLSYLLDQKVKFLLLPEVQNSTAIPTGLERFSDIFVFGLSDSFLKALSTQYHINLVQVTETLWRSTRD